LEGNWTEAGLHHGEVVFTTMRGHKIFGKFEHGEFVQINGVQRKGEKERQPELFMSTMVTIVPKVQIGESKK
jgi:hypothetical protein